MMNAGERYSAAVEAFNRDEPAGFAAIYAEGATVRDPAYPQPISGRAAIEQDVAEMRRAMPDARFTLRPAMQEGETVAFEYGLSGTHLGPLALPDREIAPTGRKVDLPGAVFARFDAEGFIIEERRYYDVASLLAQVGVLDDVATPAG